MSEHICIVCKQEATMDSPADLCDKHWHQWFDHKLNVSEDRKSFAWACRMCGRSYSTVDPDEWHVDPVVCKSCRSCPDCKTEFKHVKPLSSCPTCRQNFCLEHSMDRRSPFHALWCYPGEW